MHPNPIFRRAEDSLSLDFARERGFGVLTINGPAGPLLAHVPFLLDAGGGQAELHLARSNPILRLLDTPQAAVIAVSGPDAYVSPDWYGVEDQVPTWNYVAVHLRGPLERLPQDRLAEMLDRQSAHAEATLTPKRPWTADKMTPELRTRMMRAIVPCRLRVEIVENTWKLSQNKSCDARAMAAAGVAAGGGPGQEATLLAGLMDTPPARA
ncbi:hypothetical protein LCGC14_2174000 [marine sediment metagenome]|uniref:Negative transcriptional regulator n=1 Tax=marine sediment metagenome TaxID=412755 RepID=A0A0F9DP46_9ZZZZ